MHNCIADEGVVVSWDGVVKIEGYVECELDEDEVVEVVGSELDEGEVVKVVGSELDEDNVEGEVVEDNVEGEIVKIVVGELDEDEFDEDDVEGEVVEDVKGILVEGDVWGDCVMFSVSITVAPGINVINWSVNILFLKNKSNCLKLFTY